MHKTFSPCELGCELDGTAREFGDHEDIGERLRRHPGFTRGGGFFSGMNGGFEAAGLTRRRTTEWDEDSQTMVEVARYYDSSGKNLPLLEEKFSHNPTSGQSSSRIGSERMNGIERPNQDSFGFFLHCLDEPEHLLVEAWMQEGESELHIKVGESSTRTSLKTKNGLEIACASCNAKDSSCNVTEKINWNNLKEKIEKLRTSKTPNLKLIIKTPWRRIS